MSSRARPRIPGLLFALLVWAGQPEAVAGQTVVDRVNDQFARQRPDAPDQRSVDPADSDGSDDDGESFFSQLLGDVFAATVDAAAGPAERCRWPAYPYAGGQDWLALGALDDGAGRAAVKPWSVRLSADGGGDFDGLTRRGAELFLDTDAHRLGLLARVTSYHARENGESADAVLTDAAVTYRLVQTPHGALHVGLGGRAWRSAGDTHGGVNVLARIDLFPVKPWHVSFSADAGRLDQLSFVRLRPEIGVTWRHGELFAGYEWTRIARETLQGPLVGVRLWF